jgi:hypothetical protein
MIKRWIINVIDRSGSMKNLKDTVIGEYNLFLNETKQNINDIRWTSILFNNEVNVLNDDSVKNILDLQDTEYSPNAGTALLDAIGQACIKIINNTVEYNDIVMNIFTDGIENSSKNYTYVSVNDLLESIKNKESLTTNFYCTSTDSLNVPSRIPSIDTRYVNANFPTCMRAMSSNSQSVPEHLSAPVSCPQIKRQKLI